MRKLLLTKLFHFTIIKILTVKILITGGSGFIGSRLMVLLIDSVDTLTNYDKNISRKFPDLTIIGNIRNYKFLDESLKDKDTIIHLAAEHRDDISPKSLYYNVNCTGTENVIKAAVNNNIKHIMFTSTVAIYGLNPSSTKESSEAQPFNDYGKSKLIAEEKLISWARESEDRKLIIIRPTVIFGEENRGNVYQLFNQIINNKFIIIGNGKNKKSIAYVGNLVLFMNETLKFGNGIHIYNYADKPDYTMNELVNMININYCFNKTILRIPRSLGLFVGSFIDLVSKLTNRKYNISKIRIKKFISDSIISTDKLNSTNFQPKYSLKNAIDKTIRYDFNIND